MNRRSLLKIAASLPLAAATSGLMARPKRPPSGPPPLIKPRALRPGMTIGLIAPGSPAPEDDDLQFGTEMIESLGFKVKRGANLGQRWGYLAGSDAQRAGDINTFFLDPEVDAIMAFRGGYGCLRLLPHLDFAAIKANPKVFLGFSDITALLIAIQKKTGLVTFHGPIAWWSMTDYTFQTYQKVLVQGASPILLGAPLPFVGGPGRAREENRVVTITSGQAEGPLIGGNLSVLCRMMGTPYEPDFKGAILILEDVGEEPYSIDGMLTQLRLSGRLKDVAGVVFGTCIDCKPTGNSLSLEAVLRDRLGDLGVPVLKGLMIGHQQDMATVPMGCRAKLDADGKTLALLEAGVQVKG